MSFLAPLFLLGALGIAAPILYHLIRRSTRERTLFSSLMFLLPTPPRLTKKSRLEDILLLLLRCLALAVFAFAFARPFIRTNAIAPAAPTVGRHVVVLLDSSASMQRGDLWDEAQDRALEIVRDAEPIDDVALYTFDRQPRTLLSFEEWAATPVDQRAALASNRIRGVEPGWRSTNLGNALIAAAEALEDAEAQREAPGPREIVLVSDLQEGSQLGTLQAFEWPRGIQLTLATIRVPGRSNAGIQLVPDAPEADPDAEPAARVRVTNARNSNQDRFQVGWSRGGASPGIVGSPVEVDVPAGQSVVVRVPTPPQADGLTQLVLLGDDDSFDNVVHAVPPEKQQVKVMYFGTEADNDNSQLRFFLSRVVTSIEDSRASVSLVAPELGQAPAPQDFQDAKLYFVSDGASPTTAGELRSQMEAGKTVVVIPKSSEQAVVIGQLLGVPPVSLSEGMPPGANGPVRAGATPPYSILGEINYEHPLFSLFADPRYSDFSKIHFWRHRQLRIDDLGEARVLARFENRAPAVVEFPVGRGRLIVLLSGWNRADSDIAQSTRFPLLIYSMLDMSGSLSSQAGQYAVGDPLPVATIAGTTAQITVTPPGGEPTQLADGATAFPDTRTPGIYTVAAGVRTFRVGVNLDPAESRTAPMPADELERYGAPGSAPVANAAYEARKEALLQGTEAEGRQKLWRWFVGAALVILVLETLLAGWTARRNAASFESGGLPS
jgi:hypothetical protein